MASDKRRQKPTPQPFVHPDGDRRRRGGPSVEQAIADKHARQEFAGGVPADLHTDTTRVSKFLSLVLRHKPDAIGLTLDENGWAEVYDLIRLCNDNGRPLTRQLLDRVVAENDKKRFVFSDDGRRIRASQGHSVEVDPGLPPAEPPEVLYHGTATRFLDSIRAGGLNPGRRRHVHLSPDTVTATRVGQRHGRPVVLVVRAKDMAAAGHAFYVSANGVWLTERVPAEYLTFPGAEVG